MKLLKDTIIQKNDDTFHIDSTNLANIFNGKVIYPYKFHFNPDEFELIKEDIYDWGKRNLKGKISYSHEMRPDSFECYQVVLLSNKDDALQFKLCWVNNYYDYDADN